MIEKTFNLLAGALVVLLVLSMLAWWASLRFSPGPW